MLSTARQPRPPGACAACPVRRHTLYAPIAESRAAEIAALRRESLMIPARRIILRQGEVPSTVFVLYDGWAFRFTLLSDGRRQILSFLLPGELISLPALRLAPLRFSVQALTAVSLCAFNTKDLAGFVQDNPVLTMSLVNECAREAESADRRVTDLGRRSATERVARLILEIESRLRALDRVEGDSFEFPLRQEHIADALGLTAVHVSRTLSGLRDEGLLSLGQGVLMMHNRQRLLEMFGNDDTSAPS